LIDLHVTLIGVDAQVRTEVNDRPKPLYFSTASQLGFHKTRGVPALLDALLPPSGKSHLLLCCHIPEIHTCRACTLLN
jgi:hypothetical protein